MNQIIIEGNVVRDSTVKETPKGTKVCIMPIASNRSYRDGNGEYQSEVGYFDIQAWGQGFSERVVRLGTKGRGVRVVGRIKQDRWKDENGKSKEKTYIIAEHIEFKGGTKSAESDGKNIENPDSELKNLEVAAKGAVEEKVLEAVF